MSHKLDVKYLLDSLPDHPTILLLRELVESNVFNGGQEKELYNIIYNWMLRNKDKLESLIKD